MKQYLNLIRGISLGLALALLQACATMDAQQQTEYALMQKDGVLVQEKNPSSGAWFGLLPGGGAFYGRSPWVGVVDLLAWPLSILWDPFVGYERSKMINYEVTVAKLNRDREKAISDLDELLRKGDIDQDEYAARKRSIDQKYDYSS